MIAAAILLVGVGLAIAAQSAGMVVGLMAGGVSTLGWIGGKFRQEFVRADLSKAREGIDKRRMELAVRGFMGTVPTIIIGLVLVIVGVQVPIVEIPAGVFVAMGVSFLTMFIGLWVALAHPPSSSG